MNKHVEMINELHKFASAKSLVDFEMGFEILQNMCDVKNKMIPFNASTYAALYRAINEFSDKCSRVDYPYGEEMYAWHERREWIYAVRDKCNRLKSQIRFYYEKWESNENYFNMAAGYHQHNKPGKYDKHKKTI